MSSSLEASPRSNRGILWAGVAGVRGYAWLVVALSCRPHSTGAAGDAGDLPAQLRVSALGEKVRSLRFARPLTAARMERGIAVVARDRASGELAFTGFDEGGVSLLSPVPLPEKLEEPELLVTSGDVAVLARARLDGATVRVAVRIARATEGGPRVIGLEPTGSAACATSDGVYSIERDKAGWRGSFRTLGSSTSDEAGPQLGESSQATIVCGQHRAFVVLQGRGELRVAAWAPSAHDERATTLPPAPGARPDENALMAAKDDDLVVAQLGKSSLATLVLQEKRSAIWRLGEVAAGGDVALEALEPGERLIAMLLIRTTKGAKGCTGNEKTDAELEVALVDAASGKLVRAPERIETWRCGAEPGPFFSGWLGGKLVVAWPRAADSACAHAGVRRGGIAFAQVAPDGGSIRVANIVRPADAIAGAGCDDRKCYAVALTRGNDPCGAAEGPDAGRLELIAYP